MEFEHTEGVYAPREDSFLTVEGVEKNIDAVSKDGMVEVGVGSGYVIINIRKYCDSGIFVGTDINFNAARQARTNAIKHGADVHVICCSFTQPFRRNGLPRIYVFNPPYLPSDPEVDVNLTDDELTALIGGEKGTEVMEDFLKELPSPSVAFCIVSSLATTLEDLERSLKRWSITVVAERSFSFERLWLVKFSD